MRSQLFGFHIQTHFIYEAVLACPLVQAHELTIQHIRKFDTLERRLDKRQVTILGQAYTVGIEVPLNPWCDETESVVSQILKQHAFTDEMERMETLRSALAWLWPQFRTTAVSAQFLLSATIDGETHLSLLAGWNEGAAVADTDFSSDFVQLYFRHLEQLKLPFQWTAVPATSSRPEPRKYGARLDTLKKLQDLKKYREESKKSGEVTINRMEGCDKADITLATFKRYDPFLYDRWYDASY